MKYLVICYAVHERRVASVRTSKEYEFALNEMERDAKNAFNEENANSSSKPELVIDGNTAQLTSCDGDCIWTWEVFSVPHES